MGDEPPPLPPKMRNIGLKYSEEDQARALLEEEKAFEKIRQQKLERSNSQRSDHLVNQRLKHDNFWSMQNKEQPTDQKDGGNSMPKIRPVQPQRSETPSNDNKSNTNGKNDNRVNLSLSTKEDMNLMSFISPEKPKSEINEILEKLHLVNKNQHALVPLTSASVFSQHSALVYSQSMPLSMNIYGRQPSPVWQGNLSNSSNISPYGNNHPNLNMQTTLVNPYNLSPGINTNRNISPFFQSQNISAPLNQLNNAHLNQNLNKNFPFTPSPTMNTNKGTLSRNNLDLYNTVPVTSKSNSINNFQISSNKNIDIPSNFGLNNSASNSSICHSISPSVKNSSYTSSTCIPPPVPNRSAVLDMSKLHSSNQSALSITSPLEYKLNLSLKSEKVPASFRVLRETPLQNDSSDLIDFGHDSPEDKYSQDKRGMTNSVLFDFDPLIATVKDAEKSSILSIEDDNINLSNEAKELLHYKRSRQMMDDEQSYYEQVNPFEYMQGSAAASTRSDPVLDIYDGLGSPGALGGDLFEMPPPLPPRVEASKDEEVIIRESRGRSSSRLSRVRKRSTTVHEGVGSFQIVNSITITKSNSLVADDEATAFWERIKKLRDQYPHDDHIGNPGLLHSPCLESSIDFNLSVKLSVHYEERGPAYFTSNLTTSIEHVVMQSMETLDIAGECSEYVLKVRGIDEYLCGDTQLGEYDYVHLCVKYDADVLFSLIKVGETKKAYIRTIEDDSSIENVKVESLLTVGSEDAIYYNSLKIALDAFENELTKLHFCGFQLIEGTPIQDLNSPMRSKHMRQVVKQICALLGNLETVEITSALEFLIDTCRMIQKSQGILDGEEDDTSQSKAGGLSTGNQSEPPDELKCSLLNSLSKMSAALNNFLLMYARAFRVDFTLEENVDEVEDVHQLIDVREKVRIKICGLHRLQNEWSFDQYFVEAQLNHGTSCVGLSSHSKSLGVTTNPRFYAKVNFKEWLDFGIRVNNLPRECRLVLTVYGATLQPTERQTDPPKYIREQLGWASMQMFSFNGYLSTGDHLLTLWPMSCDRRLGPAPWSSDHPFAYSCPILSIKMMEFTFPVEFPEIVPLPVKHLNFEDLDVNSQQQLMDIIERDIFTFRRSSLAEREILWEKRHYLHTFPSALAKILLSAHTWDICSLPDLHSLINGWCCPQPQDALHLLLPIFPDTVIRNKAVEWIRNLGSDELLTYLPQMVQATKHEAWDVSKLTELLLERALTSPRLAHHLYWLLNQCLPLQTNMGGERSVVLDARYRRRLHLISRSLMIICGSNMEERLLRQEAVLRTMYEAAVAIKDAKDCLRTTILHHDLKNIHENLQENPTSLPLSPSLEVCGVDIGACSYYNSFSVPLKLAFLSSELDTQHIHTIFKVGDDLRQDMLVIQMIRLMDKLWLKDGLDLKIVTFNIVPTGDRIGIIEMVREAETLRKIQTENGLTGSFQERPIAEWLAMQNPSQLEYHRAVSNFTASCAGYCVATYILGICDRHNDNIMLKRSGHLFHIDFGKFLGDAQKFGNFKRDRTPFVLTADMAYVINGGEKPSDKFQVFVDLCCRAFNIIRQNAHLLLYLFALMASSGIPGVTWEAVNYVEKALLQDRTNAEAGAFFAKMVQESLKSWFTQVNFFIHNLAQMRFTGENCENGGLLSFVPHTYTMAQDGRIKKVRLFNFQKRYNPNKYYVYILRVEREEQKEPSFLFRSYKEFSEFHQKLCCLFPLATLHSLPKGVQIGRSEVKAVAEKRKIDIELLLSSLFSLAPEISHSDIVYTFLHPLLRDQEDTDIHLKKLKPRDSQPVPSVQPSTGRSLGQVKVSLQYFRGELEIIVQHARNLSNCGSLEPSPYVKLYLLPDPNKKTKRKTKVVNKTCHPTFMEVITYRMSLDILHEKTLEVSLWNEDRFSENTYLGSAYLKLCNMKIKQEMCEWLSLEYNIKTARDHMLRGNVAGLRTIR